MSGKRLSLFALTLLAACAGESPDRMAADSLSRDLQRAPMDSSAVLNDPAPAASFPTTTTFTVTVTAPPSPTVIDGPAYAVVMVTSS